ARSATPWCLVGRKPVPQSREKSAWLPDFELHREWSTTNAGRSWLGLPMPYESQAPVLGRPGNWLPVWMNVIAGSWLIASVCIVLTIATSSAIEPRWGNSSLNQAPCLPYCWNLKSEGAIG